MWPPRSSGPRRHWSTWHNNWNGIPSDMYISQLQFINSLINVVLSRTTILLPQEANERRRSPSVSSARGEKGESLVGKYACV